MGSVKQTGMQSKLAPVVRRLQQRLRTYDWVDPAHIDLILCAADSPQTFIVEDIGSSHTWDEDQGRLTAAEAYEASVERTLTEYGEMTPAVWAMKYYGRLRGVVMGKEATVRGPFSVTGEPKPAEPTTAPNLVQQVTENLLALPAKIKAKADLLDNIAYDLASARAEYELQAAKVKYGVLFAAQLQEGGKVISPKNDQQRDAMIAVSVGAHPDLVALNSEIRHVDKQFKGILTELTELRDLQKAWLKIADLLISKEHNNGS